MPTAGLSAILGFGPAMQPTFPTPPPPPRWPPEDTGSTRLREPREKKAVASLVLGILCVAGTLCGMGLSLGVPAIVLGALAHRDIGRSAGTTSGGGLATAGIVLGSIGSTIFVGWVAMVATAMILSGSTSRPFSPLSPIHLLEPAPAVTSPTPHPPRTAVFELHPSGGSLRAQLVNHTSSAQGAGEEVLVETSMSTCDPCTEIALAVRDPAVLAALTKVRLLRIDVREFRSELAGLRMNEPTVPWFYLLDARGQPRDAISADEWDDNDAENIAPVLDAFVHGRLQPRRTSWRGRTSL
jgi:uncharacterized protein DUF4190